MLDDEFNKQRSILIRSLADKADPFIRRRLLDLASRYEKHRTRPIPPVTVRTPDPRPSKDGGEAG